MNIYEKIGRVGYLVGQLGFEIELIGQNFVMDGVMVVATIENIDGFISYLEGELNNQ